MYWHSLNSKLLLFPFLQSRTVNLSVTTNAKGHRHTRNRLGIHTVLCRYNKICLSFLNHYTVSLRRRSFFFHKMDASTFCKRMFSSSRTCIHELFEHLLLKYNRILVIRASRKKLKSSN